VYTAKQKSPNHFKCPWVL